MFWDGQRWVTPSSAGQRTSRRRTIRDWLATLPIVLLVPVLALPIIATQASTDAPDPGLAQSLAQTASTGPRLVVRGEAVPGAVVKLVGYGFKPRAVLQANWESVSLRRIWVNRFGNFTARIKIPRTAADGNYTIAVNYLAGASSQAGTRRIMSLQPSSTASLKVRVHGSAAPPGQTKAAPTVTPSPTPTPTATPAPMGIAPVGPLAPAPTVTPTPAATSAPTVTPAPQPSSSPTSAPTATPIPSPTATTSGLRTVTVASISALKTALADNTVDEIIVANGTYSLDSTSNNTADSLWIGARYASRTRPVLVRAATPGGVYFRTKAGADNVGGVTFSEGAHDQTWDGFTFQDGTPIGTAPIVFGSPGMTSLAAPPHHITMRNITVTNTIRGSGQTSHAVYFTWADSPGVHDVLLEDFTLDGTGGLFAAIHIFHSDASHPNANNIVVRRLTARGFDSALTVWDSTLRNITFDTATITDSTRFAIRYEGAGSTGIVFKDVTSTGSGMQGFYSSEGPSPPGVTFVNTSVD